MIKKFGINQVDNIQGMFRFGGALISGLQPSKITVSDGAIAFAYGSAVRSFSLERSGGNIVAFTNPDGTRTEVVRE